LNRNRSGRGTKRKRLFVEVQVRESAEVFIYKARNVSVGGMFIDAPVPPDEGTCLTLMFRLPGIGRVECAATVRWTTSAGAARAPHPGFGVAFDGLDSRSGELLRTWLGSDEAMT